MHVRGEGAGGKGGSWVYKSTLLKRLPGTMAFKRAIMPASS